jgi:HEAT repeat protein
LSGQLGKFCLFCGRGRSFRLPGFLFLVTVLFAAGTIGQDLGPVALQITAGNTEQKREALRQIRDLRSPDASRAALPALNDGDEIVRATAAGSVVFLPPAEAAAALLPLLGDRSPFVRKEAAYALGTVGDPSATPKLIGLLNDKDLEVRSAAAIALGRIGDAAAVVPLTAILQKKPTEDTEFLRRSAARSIGQIAEFVYTGRVPEVVPQNYLPERYKIISPVETDRTRQFAPAGNLLLKVFQNNSESDDTRREAAFALGALRYRPAEPQLTASLNSDDRALAEIAREALLKLKALE